MVNRMFKNTTDALLHIRVSSNIDPKIFKSGSEQKPFKT